MLRFLTTFAVLLGTSFSFAQDASKKLPGDEMIEKYLAAECDKLSQKFLDGAKTLDEWKEKLPRLQREYMDMLGLWPIPEKTPLAAKVTKVHEAHGVVVENLHFQSKPGLYVTANLYRPKAVGSESVGKFPAIVYVCGHSSKGRDGSKSAFQDHGFWFANNGYVCIILDTLQLGEIPGVHHGTYGRPWGHLGAWGVKDAEKMKNHNRFWWYSAGYTPAGVECWNGVRAIDYLLTRPEVDPERIGVTGISGGGAATFWIAAADPRVKVAVPVSGMSDLEFYVKGRGVNGHCDCMFLYNTYQWDWTTIAALIAPRPMLFANSDNDPIFPMDANRRIITKLRKVYGMYEKADLVDEYVSPGGHAYRPDLRIAIFKFLNKHLKGDAKAIVEDSAKYTPIEGRLLRAFATDDDIPKDQVNTRADEVFVPKAKVALPAKGKFEEWRKGLADHLRSQVFGPYPTPIAPATPTVVNGEKKFDRLITEDGIKVDFDSVPYKDLDKRVGVTCLVLTVDEMGMNIPSWAREFVHGTTVALWPRGNRPWNAKSPPNYVERSLALLGRSSDQGRCVDIVATVGMSGTAWKALVENRENWRLVGNGQSGVLAAYAALFEPSIKEVVLINPPKSHLEGPHFPGILRVIDIPEALGLLAPRPLTIIGGNDPAFDRTAEIYRLAGAADKLTRK